MTAPALISMGCEAQVDAKRGGKTELATSLPAAVTLTAPVLDEDVEAWVAIPEGWLPDPVKRTDKHTHKTWLSPTRETAFGIIRIKLPLPIGEEYVLWGFMREMKRSEGQAILLSKEWDPAKKVMRFEAEGGLYHIRSILTTRGITCWAVYAGTLQGHTPLPDELALATAAREATRVGK